MGNLAGKKIFITGGTRGLGFSICKMILANGGEVHTISSGEKSIKTAEKELNNPQFHAYRCDVADFKNVDKIAGKVGAVDILINNAGIWLEGNVWDNKVEDISKVIDVNVKGVIYVTRAFLPPMLNSNSGIVLNVSSTSGLKGREDQSVYVASKFAVTGFTESLKEDLKNTGIKVIGFYPGGMNTQIFEKAGHPRDNSDWMDPDKVAETIRFILDQDESMVIDHVVLNRRKKL